MSLPSNPTPHPSHLKPHPSHLARHWHHHLVWISCFAIAASFLIGAGTAAAIIRHGGYKPGPLPPAVHVSPKLGGAIPAAHSLTRFIVRIHNQGAGNSCTGQTISTIKEITVKRHRLRTHQKGAPWFAAGYAYDQVDGGRDGGATYEDIFAVATSQGIATYKRFPHDGQDWWVQPDPAARQNASHYKITSWRSISPADRYTISYEIAHGRPVAVAIPVDDIFYNQWLTPSVPTISYWDGAWKFWHSMTAVAYGPRGVTLLNSWGPQYARHGLVRISWPYLAGINDQGVPAQVVVSHPHFPRTRIRTEP